MPRRWLRAPRYTYWALRPAQYLRWAQTGVPVPAYTSQQDRDGAIDAGAGRGVAVFLTDLATSAGAFNAEVATMPEQAWRRTVRVLDYPEFPAAQLLVRRLVEVELHHVDLDAGYGPSDWPSQFAEMDLPEPMRSQRDDRKTWSAVRPGPRQES